MPYRLAPALPLAIVAPAAVQRRALVAGVVPRAATLAAGLAALEGPYTVRGVYLADANDAARVRRIVAEQLRADALRGVPSALAECRQLLQRLAVATLAARTCPWCRHPSDAASGGRWLGGRLLHSSCADAYDALHHTSPEA